MDGTITRKFNKILHGPFAPPNRPTVPTYTQVKHSSTPNYVQHHAQLCTLRHTDRTALHTYKSMNPYIHPWQVLVKSPVGRTILSPTGPFNTPLTSGSTRKHQLREAHVLSWALTFNTLFKSRASTWRRFRTVWGTSAQYSIEHAG